MNHKRLSLLARVLDRVPREHFNIRPWSENVLAPLRHSSQLNECGTTACAVGWAMTVPSFRGAGLRAAYAATEGCWTPSFGGSFGWQAASEFFGINSSEFDDLFTAQGYSDRDRTNPRAVARRIRELLKRDRKERGK